MFTCSLFPSSLWLFPFSPRPLFLFGFRQWLVKKKNSTRTRKKILLTPGSRALSSKCHVVGEGRLREFFVTLGHLLAAFALFLSLLVPTTLFFLLLLSYLLSCPLRFDLSLRSLIGPTAWPSQSLFIPIYFCFLNYFPTFFRHTDEIRKKLENDLNKKAPIKRCTLFKCFCLFHFLFFLSHQLVDFR